MALHLPEYRIDAPIVFVHASDSAWNEERILREQAEMTARGEKSADHPVAQYFAGNTRYDLESVSTFAGEPVKVSQYLDASKAPTRWFLRRLTWSEWYEVHPLWEAAVFEQKTPYACYVRCCQLGLTRVENGPVLDLPGGRPSAADMEKLYRMGHGYGYDLANDIGHAVYRASASLTDREKKASA